MIGNINTEKFSEFFPFIRVLKPSDVKFSRVMSAKEVLHFSIMETINFLIMLVMPHDFQLLFRVDLILNLFIQFTGMQQIEIFQFSSIGFTMAPGRPDYISPRMVNHRLKPGIRISGQ